MPRSFARWILGASLLAGGLILACSDKGTGPQSEAYSVLVADPVRETIWIADGRTDSVISVWPVGSMVDPIVSPDSRFLYVSITGGGNDDGGLYKYDLKTKQAMGFLPPSAGSYSGGGLTLVDNGNLLIAERHDGLYFVDPSEFRVLDVRELAIEGLQGRLDSHVLLGAVPGTFPAGVLAIYDYVGDTYDTLTVAPVGYVYGAFLHPDKRRVLVISGTRLYSVDLPLRQVEFICQLPGAGGQIAFTQTGDKAYVASGEHWPDACNDGLVLAVDCSQQHCVVTDSIVLEGQPATALALSPDEKLLYVAVQMSCVKAAVLIFTTDTFTLSDRKIEHSAMFDPEYVMTLQE
jgi:DNA-binding beta-propeller fold protein YncE